METSKRVAWDQTHRPMESQNHCFFLEEREKCSRNPICFFAPSPSIPLFSLTTFVSSIILAFMFRGLFQFPELLLTADFPVNVQCVDATSERGFLIVAWTGRCDPRGFSRIRVYVPALMPSTPTISSVDKVSHLERNWLHNICVCPNVLSRGRRDGTRRSRARSLAEVRSG